MATQSISPAAFTAVWHALAFERVRYLAATSKAFSTDDVWLVLDDLPKPSDPRALGPVMQRARQERLLERSDFTTASHRAACHARPTNVWLSVPQNGSLADAAEYVAKRKQTVSAPRFIFDTDATDSASQAEGALAP
jgi:hypothetical protein